MNSAGLSAHLIVTRVQPQAQAWVDQLQAHAYDALALPLIEVRCLKDATAGRMAWQNWPRYLAVMFVSRHAVDFFFKEKEALVLDDKEFAAIINAADFGLPETTIATISNTGKNLDKI